MKTFSANTKDVVKKWVVIDAEGQALGRVASKAAAIIRGKTKPIFTPHVDTGDNVIIVNAAKVRLTGQKWGQKIYYRHTGYIGQVKSATAQEILEKQPRDLLKKAIDGMLPKNRLGRTLKNNYRIYDTGEHPHSGQKPEPVSV
ncbi:MAG: 50S ribosomal protein L13 [Nitrospinaceae bacterium]|nr:50S ribosomal protein L13 [Nitrospinaceae bacterium]NIR54094.1 50S ribosomal protein L13 [Nitrospinaceae bacterium]NIS84512.1 50S ribosomal protein L13 [Nitrospinaceae bacterium]NIT81307.1 50S ribosomal protein L13 [Nitrospinaceae bacterium]NIU43594.1 50S ribosomal protein L13 [Nitrospinaceae bacterium]